jgi:hypothetical protein
MSDYQHLLMPRTARIVQQASFLRRTGAFLLDLLVIDFFLAAPFASLLERLAGRLQDGFTISYTSTELVAITLLFVVMYAYFVLFEYLLGQTIGMMLMATKLDGNDTAGAILLRNSFILPFFPFIVFWIIEPVAILFWRRGALEYLSRTRTTHQRQVTM